MYESARSPIPSVMMLPRATAALMGPAAFARNPSALPARLGRSNETIRPLLQPRWETKDSKKQTTGKAKQTNKQKKKAGLASLVMRFVRRVNGKLVALKVIRLQEEEGTPFTAIREGKETTAVQVAFELLIWKIILFI